ncbi:adenine deaminase [Pedobacter sp. PF22-3]|uniref:adenine deaminase n=1 Tax=Pedobacter sp. PF22-3 TaxID=2994467 RepID=UPI00224560FF|nr:adenine deaminase [Pedobacter sp. PF22-3]MCX2495545.1 adenine deaminase [Pedobacter sp. PF22-3]
MGTFKISGNIVDIIEQHIYFGEITVEAGKIKSITKISEERPNSAFITPGFIDSHVHIESSMLIPSEFARLAVVHGTVATISDPHEIANVCGMEGVEFMIENGNTVPFKFNFGAPSCVPATTFETAGAELNHHDVKALLARPEIKYLSEMMNFPGVLYKDEEVLKKIAAAHQLGKPVDGHAPGLRGDTVQKYIDAGISTDHECFTAEEALDKLQRGMKILIREGSAAKNFEALIDLLHDWPEMMMFCSDDKHPDSLVESHINEICARAVAKGIDIFNVLRAACINPILHYKLDVGALQVNDDADFIVIEDLINFKVKQTYINGLLLAENGKMTGDWINHSAGKESINHFNCSLKKEEDFFLRYTDQLEIPVIEALDGQLITNKLQAKPKVENDNIISDIENDVLKMVVVNRYYDAPIAISFVKNFGLKNGAIASSVAHDSHNIIAVGVDDKSICDAVNLVIKKTGGVVALGHGKEEVLPLPVAGLMSNHNGYEVAACYTAIDQFAKDLGSTLLAPFMTLSFMALLVIPRLKLSDKGLFDGDEFKFV